MEGGGGEKEDVTFDGIVDVTDGFCPKSADLSAFQAAYSEVRIEEFR